MPECLAGGVPTIVTAIGAAAELPAECVVKVERDISADSLAMTLADVLQNTERCAALQHAGRRYAEESSNAAVADALHKRLHRG